MKIFLRFLKTLLVGAVLSAFISNVFSAQKRPNVIIVNLDDLGAGWLSPYTKNLKPSDMDEGALKLFLKNSGNKNFDVGECLKLVESGTPYIDSLASQGVVFNRCYASSNLCAPSRTGLMTGKYQQRWGVCDLASSISKGVKNDNIPLLAENFKKAGYSCAAIGKWHVSRHNEGDFQAAVKRQKNSPKQKKQFSIVRGKKIPIDDPLEADRRSAWASCAEGEWPTDLGYDYYFGYNLHDSRYYCAADLWENKSRVPQRPEGEFLTDLFADKAAAYMEECLKENKPFLLYFAPMTMHGRLDPAPEKYAVKSSMPQIAAHVEHMRSIDETVRRFFGLLKKYGEDKNTIFVLCADNGSPYILPPSNAPYRGGKGQGWIGGSRVPLIICAPNAKPGYSNALASLLDVFPTAMDFAEIPIPDGLDGESLKPVVLGQKTKTSRKNFYTDGLHAITWYPNTDWGFVKMKTQDANRCPMFAFNISEADKVYLAISTTKKGAYKHISNEIPASLGLYDLNADCKQLSPLPGDSAEALKMRDELNMWLKSMPYPHDTMLTKNKTHAYKELLEITSK